MTYRDLQSRLEELEDEQLDFDVMCCIDDEYFGISNVGVEEKDDRLSDGHPYIIVE